MSYSRAFASADGTLDQPMLAIPLDTDLAAKKATSALRKYMTAAECARPAAVRAGS